MPRQSSAAKAANLAAQTTPNPTVSNEARPSFSGSKVIVGCKLGVPWFELQVQEKRRTSEETRTGTREIDIWVKTGPVIRLRGTAYPRGTPPTGFPSAPEMVNGYAITRDVDAGLWGLIAEQNKKNPMFVNQMVVAGPDIDYIRGVGREEEGKLSGLEPLNPTANTDKRIPKSTNKSVSDLEKGER